METLLLQFIDTLDASLKNMHKQIGDGSGVSQLTINQFQYLEAIHELGEPTITEIADKLTITKASVTAGIKKLVSMGFVLKTQSTEDRRVFHVRLTDASMPLIQVKYQTLAAYGAFIRAALTEEEAGQFETILAKLVSLFEKK